MKKISDELLKMKRIVYCGVEPYANLKMYRKRLKDDEVLVCIVPKTKVTPEPIADTTKKLKHYIKKWSHLLYIKCFSKQDAI